MHSKCHAKWASVSWTPYHAQNKLGFFEKSGRQSASSVARSVYMWNSVETWTLEVCLWNSFRIFCTRRMAAQLRGRRHKSCRHHYGGLRESLLSDRRWIRFVNNRIESERTMSGSQHNPNGRQSQLGSGWNPAMQVVIIFPLLVAHSLDLRKYCYKGACQMLRIQYILEIY